MVVLHKGVALISNKIDDLVNWNHLNSRHRQLATTHRDLDKASPCLKYIDYKLQGQPYLNNFLLNPINLRKEGIRRYRKHSLPPTQIKTHNHHNSTPVERIESWKPVRAYIQKSRIQKNAAKV